MANYFTFSVKGQNLGVYLRKAVYPANLEVPTNRAIANVKKGDVFWMWIRQEEKLYGPFIALGRIFEDHTDLGVTGNWPHRFLFRPWDQYIRVAEGPSVASLIPLLRSFKTTTDITHLGRPMNPLLIEEGEALLRFALSKSKRYSPEEFSFGSDPLSAKEELDFSTRLRVPREHIIEAYLLQRRGKLNELVGEFDEIYNQLFAGERFLDVLCVTRSCFGGEITGIRVIEIKADASYKQIVDGLRALTYYMFWCTKTLAREGSDVSGMLLTPLPTRMTKESFEEERSRVSGQYEIDPEQIGWVAYRVVNGALEFEAII